ncbi:AAA family ATPase [Diaphorobacter sp. LR2014-1]|uniref:AAA family ATPase n=1 Tax=Diaphorobacter sp. LR2014-1 TaxID=1933219 RepID=UPI000CDAC293|nr:AAA family ATPase [Diaphorobacter sp. LR2014-1]POR06868.1 hypothetical protein BV908_20460 [Diaphorobacter sp. LR2014-1]
MAEIQDAKLVIVRGLPGSGKSTLAREIAKTCGHLHFENDMFFETENGYAYDAARIGAAQRWRFLSARDAVLAGKKVVVSNCHDPCGSPWMMEDTGGVRASAGRGRSIL